MTLPKNTWVHGETPTAAEINKYGATLDAAHDALGDVALNFPTLADVSSAVFVLPHRHRYLWFRSTGAIEDMSGSGDSVSISDENNAPTKYDLNSVSWLYYGLVYRVVGVSWALESET